MATHRIMTAMDHSRRFFLKGKFSSSEKKPTPRPPWAIEPDASFTQKCTRCLECIHACPTSILTAGESGFPEVNFQSNGCDECEKCVEICKPKALVKLNDQPAWTWTAQIKEGCLASKQVECRVCGEICDHRAIRFKPQLGRISTPEVLSGNCTGCGHCVSKCPSNAIEMK